MAWQVNTTLDYDTEAMAAVGFHLTATIVVTAGGQPLRSSECPYPLHPVPISPSPWGRSRYRCAKFPLDPQTNTQRRKCSSPVAPVMPNPEGILYAIPEGNPVMAP